MLGCILGLRGGCAFCRGRRRLQLKCVCVCAFLICPGMVRGLSWLILCLFLVRTEKLQNESFPNFWNFRPGFCPEFCSEFSPNFSRTFRASFRGRRRPEKIHQKIPAIFQCKIPRQTRKNYSQNSSGEQAK